MDNGPGLGPVMERPYRIYVRMRNSPYPVVFSATRLPGTEDELANWITSEVVKLDEEITPHAGLLWIDMDDVQAISFVRVNGSERP